MPIDDIKPNAGTAFVTSHKMQLAAHIIRLDICCKCGYCTFAGCSEHGCALSKHGQFHCGINIYVVMITAFLTIQSLDYALVAPGIRP